MILGITSRRSQRQMCAGAMQMQGFYFRLLKIFQALPARPRLRGLRPFVSAFPLFSKQGLTFSQIS